MQFQKPQKKTQQAWACFRSHQSGIIWQDRACAQGTAPPS